MDTHPIRRGFVASLAALSLSGCLGSRGDSSEDERNDSSGPEQDEQNGAEKQQCEVPNRTQQGEAEPIELTAPLNERDEDEIEQVCAKEAAVAALERLDERLEVDLDDAEWISAGWSHDGSEYAPWIEVVAKIDRDGTVISCPAPDFDFDEALSHLPRTVTVTEAKSDRNGDRPRHRCTHEITLAQTTGHLD